MPEIPPAVPGTAVRLVDTMASLRAIDTSRLPESVLVVLDGFASGNDGGGGNFVWRATLTDDDDGGTVVQPDAIAAPDPGRWVRLFSGAINARWFGAGLGSADDAPLIQRAIEKAIHSGFPSSTAFGSNVCLPAGNYNIGQPIFIETSDAEYQGWVSVRLTGDGKFNTHLRLTGRYSTAIVFGGLSQSAQPEGPGARLRHCEISNLSIEQAGDKQLRDGAITFAGGGIGFLILNVAMYGVWRGITCSGSAASITWRAKLQNVHMEGVTNVGIYARYALNWDVSNTFIGGLDWSPDPAPYDTAGIWLDTRTEGWMFTILETGGFDTGLRMTNSAPDERPPDTHQFVQCNFDAGGRACIWLTNSHRCRFQGCYASSANSTLTGVVVLDSADVYGFEWADSVILNAHTYGFWISDATNFSIMGSTFATWGKVETPAGDRPTYEAITIAGAPTWESAHMSFIVTGNTFYNDPDFPAYGNNDLKPVRVQGAPLGFFEKYIVANNMSYGANVIASTDEGTATKQSVFANNL